MRTGPEVVVAMLTFRRELELARALPLVVEQARHADTSVEIVVVDNDPAASAAHAVARYRELGVRYVHEPTPGIAPARNRAMDEAGDAAAIVFVDDDETPSERWLADLVATWRAQRCAAVSGPVRTAFAVPPSEWVLASAMFRRRTYPTGTRVRSAATNNLLLDLQAVRSVGLRFADAYGLTGGEDTIFTHELVRLGLPIVWCDEAEVVEHVPAARLTRGWVLRREFRSGTSYSHMRLRQPGTRRGRVRARSELTVKGGVRIVLGIGRLLRGVVRNDVTDRARGACVAAGNAGLVTGAFGLRVREYRRRAEAGPAGRVSERADVGAPDRLSDDRRDVGR